jgi:hypothetical protein
MNISCPTLEICYNYYPKKCNDIGYKCELGPDCKSCKHYGITVIVNSHHYLIASDYYYIKKHMIPILLNHREIGMKII